MIKNALLILIWMINVLMLQHFFDLSGKLALFIFIVGVMVWAQFRKRTISHTIPILMLISLLAWLSTIEARNDRDWLDEVSVLPLITINSNHVSIENFRDFSWYGINKSDLNWETREYDLNKLNKLLLIVVPFHDSKYMAHTMLGFEFEGQGNVIVSVETRKERDEDYSLIAGALRQLELIYIFGSERDLLTLRAVHRNSKLHYYPIKATPEFIVTLFKDIAESANLLHDKPKFYRTLRDNCTTTLVKHIDRQYENKIGLRMGTIFPAKAGELLYKFGRMDTHLPFEQINEVSRVDHFVKHFEKEDEFSSLLHAEVERAYNP